MEGETFEKWHVFDPKTTSWWEKREMGADDDPYNQVPKIAKTDPLHQEYLKAAEESLATCLKESNTQEGWSDLGETEGIKTSFKDLKDSPIRCFKGVGILSASAEVLRLHLVQLDLRKYWDEMFLGGQFLFEVEKSIRGVYYSFKAPWPVSSRDFVCVAAEMMTEDGTVVSAARSVVWGDIPEKNGFVRGVLGPSAFVIKPLSNADDGTPRCEVTYIVQVDPAGWIPTWVINTVNGSQTTCINKLQRVVHLTETMIKQMLLKLFALSDADWNAVNIKNVITQVLALNEGVPEMLWDPLRYLMTGKRTGDASIVNTMEKKGKKECLEKLWTGILPYAKSIASKELYEQARSQGLVAK